MFYLDTSAFRKVRVKEEHSTALRLSIRPVDVDRRLSAVTMVVLAETTLLAARSVGTSDLRTLDALHLATVPVITPGLPDDWWRRD